MEFERATIIEALNALAKKDPRYKLFGASVHRYRLNPPLNSKSVQAFGKKHKLSLPRDYRYFITTVGNGGAGPYYGLLPFGKDDQGDKWEQSWLLGDVSKKFPHIKDWRLPKSIWINRPDPDADLPDDEEERVWDKVLETNYWTPTLMNGAIPICHLGCNYREWLVVKGKQRGYIWCDSRAGGDGPGKAIFALRTASRKQLTFADWYSLWLRDPRKAMALN